MNKSDWWPTFMNRWGMGVGKASLNLLDRNRKLLEVVVCVLLAKGVGGLVVRWASKQPAAS